ncbi:hypothetical protein PFISCL1PPCAC_12851, partial [Pristionchus fissidentatus]
MILVIVCACIIIYVVLYYRNVRKYPPGPFPLPLIGNLYHLDPENLHEYLHQVGKEYGNCFTLFFPRPIVYLTDFPNIKEALVTKGEIFAGRSHLPPEALLQKLDQTGVLFSDGDVWREQRRASLRILRELGMGKNMMEANVNRSIDEMLEQLAEIGDSVTPIDMSLPIQLCVGNVINEVLLGYHFKHSNSAKFEFYVGCLTKYLQNIRENFFITIIMTWPWMKHLPIIGDRGYKDVVANISQYQEFIEEEVNKVAELYGADKEPTNFVQSYLAEMRRNTDLDIENLYAIVVDFWLAGMETTGTTLRWGLLHLMKNTHVQEKMRDELLSIVGRERRLEIADKPNLPYFNAAVTEIQRVANILPLAALHRCTEDAVVGAKFIPADTLISLQYFSVLKDDPTFENPVAFLPERFLEKDGKTIDKRQVERMIAFGLGKRQCVGEALARMELFLVLGNLLLNYSFEPIEPLDFTPIFGTMLLPKPHKCLLRKI